jgi:hypothetical protein
MLRQTAHAAHCTHACVVHGTCLNLASANSQIHEDQKDDVLYNLCVLTPSRICADDVQTPGQGTRLNSCRQVLRAHTQALCSYADTGTELMARHPAEVARTQVHGIHLSPCRFADGGNVLPEVLRVGAKSVNKHHGGDAGLRFVCRRSCNHVMAPAACMSRRVCVQGMLLPGGSVPSAMLHCTSHCLLS